MKSYIVEIEENNKPDNENLMRIIKALAQAGIKTKSAGIQNIKEITLKNKK